jgi:hypothetical protein
LPIEKRLPQWTFGAISARQYTDPNRKLMRKVILSPVHLFSVNWAMGGPAFDWPEGYHMTWLPTHDRYVVTASADGDDCFGYRDFALGSVPAGGDVRDAACVVNARNWRRKRRVSPQARWQSFMQAER